MIVRDSTVSGGEVYGELLVARNWLVNLGGQQMVLMTSGEAVYLF